MMVSPKLGPAPPAVGVKVNVAADAVLPATRWPVATLNVTPVTMPPITPDAMPATDGVTSTLVCTVTSPPAAATPMVRPESVTVTAVGCGSRLPPVLVMTMEVALVAPALSVAALFCKRVGVTDETKNPDG